MILEHGHKKFFLILLIIFFCFLISSCSSKYDYKDEKHMYVKLDLALKNYSYEILALEKYETTEDYILYDLLWSKNQEEYSCLVKYSANEKYVKLIYLKDFEAGLFANVKLVWDVCSLKGPTKVFSLDEIVLITSE